jgi:hypothetical protein
LSNHYERGSEEVHLVERRNKGEMEVLVMADKGMQGTAPGQGEKVERLRKALMAYL